MLMFDDSFQLSEQYFTVLQLLRIFQDWIEEVEKGIGDLRKELIGQYESWRVWRRRYAPEDEEEWPLDMEKLEADFERVQDFFELRVSPLKERIRRKKEEVESLRDGVCQFLLYFYALIIPRLEKHLIVNWENSSSTPPHSERPSRQRR